MVETELIPANFSDKVTSYRPDIFIGFVSFVGTDIKPTVKTLGYSFKQFGYKTIHIKITDAFPELDKKFKLNILKEPYPKGKRIERYIDCGDKLREYNKNNEFLAQYAINELIEQRAKQGNNAKLGSPSQSIPIAYIIDQLKTKEELKLLKSVYGKAFFQISIYSARDRRVDYLAKNKAKADKTRRASDYRPKAEELVNQDYDEKLSYGQNVGKLLQLADIIINADDTEEHPIEKQISRFVELLFGSNKYSPNRMEYGMYLAHSAALRSLDLSRQVGAAIFRCTGEIATLGCNEVPKAGGGTYWTDETYDAREYTKGGDSNEERKKELLADLELILKNHCTDGNKKNLLESIIKSAETDLDDSQFMDALEYGRIVHAEMNAITDAARRGISLKDAILYCTTFPCHMCAKHIIAAGLKRVVFLEPYPKSLTSDMHPDSVHIEGASRESYQKYPAVNFSHFFGITANRFAELFQRGKRESKSGTFQDYQNGKIIPIFAPYEVDGTAEDKAAEKFAEYFAPPNAEPVVGDIAG